MHGTVSVNSLTIITVCYNAADTLGRCLNSIAKQRFANFNHLVIDGASDDNTVEILNAFGYGQYSNEATPSKKSRLYLSERDDGVYFAMNKGIELASTSHCLFLNADDYLFDEFATEGIISNIEIDRVSVFGIQYIEGSLSRNFRPTNTGTSDILYDKSLRRCPHPSSVFPVSDLRFDTRYFYAADYQFVLENIGKYGSAKPSRNLISVMCRSGQQLSNVGRDKMKIETDLIAQRFNGKAELTPAMFRWVLRNCFAIGKKYLWKIGVNDFSDNDT